MPPPINSDEDEKRYFELRKDGKIYVSKLFRYSENDLPSRNVKIVFENADTAEFGELEGGLQIRVSPKAKNQVAAAVFQDNKKIRRLSLMAFRESRGVYRADSKDSFTFRDDEFQRLLLFLRSIQFIDFSNIDTFQIEDQSTQVGKKTIVDRADANLITSLKTMSTSDRRAFLVSLGNSLSNEEIERLLGRRQALQEFKAQLDANEWNEKSWQAFFERNFWIFGYGLDYRVMRMFDREMTVGHGGTANQDKPIVDFLATFTDFTALVEIKTPATPIFRNSRGTRSGIARFSTEFIDAVSQVLEQKAEWLNFGQISSHRDRTGARRLEQRTKDTKIVLVVGSKTSFSETDNDRESEVRLDTFELFRRDNRNIERATCKTRGDFVGRGIF